MNKKKALISVSDKRGIVELAAALIELDWEVLSTGGSSRVLRSAGIPVTDVKEVTKHDEIMEGRVKTLHPAIHAGILARRDNEMDLATLESHGYGTIDLVAVNLYPFEETVSDSSVSMSQAMAQVDVGGPTMLRAAAKNHKDVWVVVDPRDYGKLLESIRLGQEKTLEVRQDLARKVFDHLSNYDRAISGYLYEDAVEKGVYPLKMSLVGNLAETLRYGENPTQKAAFYSMGDGNHGLSALKQVQGKALSYNNFLDLDGALLCLSPFAQCSDPVVCIVKHTTPCGISKGASLLEAYDGAHGCDPQSAFGSVISTNQAVDASVAKKMIEHFIECVVAPYYTQEALEILSQKKNLRLMMWDTTSDDGRHLTGDENTTTGQANFLTDYGRMPDPTTFRSVYGGFLVQEPAPTPFYGMMYDEWKVVTKVSPTKQEFDDLCFAWSCVFGVKSNAIVLVRSGKTIGIGAGQMSRVDSSRLAVLKAQDNGAALEGCVLASDAFFPFRDGVDAAVEAGVSSIIQPGGSVRDEEVVRAADEHGISMMFTGNRSFRH